MNKQNIVIDVKDIPRIISYKTYCEYAKEYGIRIHYKIYHDDYVLYRKKPMSQLSDEIYNYENENNITNGLYFY